MKKNYLFLLLSFFTLISVLSCTVDEKKGLIVISNSSAGKVELNLNLTKKSNVSVARGVKHDLWFFQPESGHISCSKAELLMIAAGYDRASGENYYSDKSDCTFKQGYRYEIKLVNLYLQPGIVNYSGLNNLILVVEPGIKVGGDSSDPDYLHYPGK